MRKLTPQEKERMRLNPTTRKRGKAHPVRLQLEYLQVSEILHILPADFKWKKRTPLYFITQIEKASDKKFVMQELHDKNGWVVERMK